MKLISNVILVVLAGSMLQACTGPSGMNKQGGGTLIGGATGALLGAQFGKGDGKLVAVGAGALLGALLGGAIGAGMDEQDKKLAELSTQKALESAPANSNVGWHNPDNGHYGYVKPHKAYRNSYGQNCRGYTQSVVIEGKLQEVTGTACRTSNGQWKIVD